ncbi:MAG TPA: DnaA regulatory inactivator Hda [Pseudidiomarina sp.]|nr:DnaA regulatory inactivator Hda [Pseudidiomarina sp.]
MNLQQLPLAMQLPDTHTFSTFVVGDNQEVLALLRETKVPFVYLWGAHGAGKSHLLHAMCAQLHLDSTAMYVPLKELVEQRVTPSILRGLEQFSLVCIDDLDAVIAQHDWCYELFALFNRIQDSGHTRLLATAAMSPTQLPAAIPDTQSRLQWGIAVQLKPLVDSEKAIALQRRAAALGLQLRDETAVFMVQRLGRDMAELIATLAKLDRASMAAKRRLTIPFVKQVLDI